MDIYLINLDKRPDRLAAMQSQLAAQGLDFTRIAAVDGTGKAEIGYPDDLPGMTKPEYACYLSHLLAYRALIESGEPRALVLEDDMILSADFAKWLETPEFYGDQNSITRLEIPFDCCRDRPIRLRRRPAAKAKGCTVERVAGPVECTGTYVISRDVAARVVKEHPTPEMAIDVLLLVNRLGEPKIEVLQLDPPKAIQNRFLPRFARTDAAHSDLEGLRGNRFQATYSLPYLSPHMQRILHQGWRNFRYNARAISRYAVGFFFKDKLLKFDDRGLDGAQN